MKIMGQNYKAITPDLRVGDNVGQKVRQTSDKTESKDSLTIHGSSDEQLSTSRFVDILKQKISSEVNAGAAPEKLDALKQQIAFQEYDINVTDIVRKMIQDDGTEV